MADEENVEKIQKLIDKYNKLSAKKHLLEQERDDLEKKAFKMLADSMQDSMENSEENEE